MVFSKHSFGYIDLEKLLSENSGKIENVFLDMGSSFTVENEYGYKVDGDKIEIWDKKKGKKIKISKKIELTADFIACIGLYEGDGSKHSVGGSPIGFSQREIHLLKFMKDQLERVFGKNFTLSWCILDDPRTLLGKERRKKLEEYKKKQKRKAPLKCQCSGIKSCSCGATQLQKDFIVNEFQNEGKKIRMTINSSDIKSTTLSSKKGGLERIFNFDDSKDFLALWLKMEHTVVGNIVNNIKTSNNGGIVFHSNPHDSNHVLDVEKYIKSIKWKLKKREGSYTVVIDKNKLYVSRSKNKKIILEKELKISPLICVSSGLYLAEGSTKKDYFFLFDKKYMKNVSKAFSLTHTDAMNIQAYCIFLEKLGEKILVSWKVKIGEKYVTEVELIAQRHGVVLLRGGDLGQGYLRTSELDKFSKEFALNQVEYLKNYSELFHHTEVTGVGIPRVDIAGKTMLIFYLMSLIRDIAICVGNLDKFMKKKRTSKNV